MYYSFSFMSSSRLLLKELMLSTNITQGVSVTLLADIAAVYITHASVHGLFRLNIGKWLDKVVSPRRIADHEGDSQVRVDRLSRSDRLVVCTEDLV